MTMTSYVVHMHEVNQDVMTDKNFDVASESIDHFPEPNLDRLLARLIHAIMAEENAYPSIDILCEAGSFFD